MTGNCPFDKIGKYDPLDKIAAGSFGIVCRARDSQMGRTVALKVLRADTYDPKIVARFQSELHLVASLHHPNIVQVIEAFEHEGRHCIVMEYLDGQPLSHLLNDTNPLSLPEAIRILKPLAEALDYAHQNGVIHLDVKPGNVILANHGERPVLTDFGLARPLQTERLASTRSIFGTVEYMAPEQILGQYPAPSMDLYALGVIAFQMLTGHLPFNGSPYEMQKGHVEQDPPRPRDLNTALPPGVEQTLLRALSKAPDQRYPSAVAFVQALQAQSASEKAARSDAQRPEQERQDKPPLSEPANARVAISENHTEHTERLQTDMTDSKPPNDAVWPVALVIMAIIVLVIMIFGIVALLALVK